MRALLAFIAALALLASQGFSVLHFVLVPHHLCELHGTLEDGASLAHRADEPSAKPEPGATQAGDSSGDTHEACTVAALAKHGAVAARALPPAVDIGGNVVAIESGRADVKPDRSAVLARAPKLSPPRIG